AAHVRQRAGAAVQAARGLEQPRDVGCSGGRVSGRMSGAGITAAVGADAISLAGRHVVVTGGGRGVGRAIAEGVLALGASVTVVDRDPAGLEELEAQHGARLMGAVADVVDEAAAARCVDATL